MKFYVITLKITTLLSKTPSLFNGLRLIAVGNILFYQNYRILLVLIVKKKINDPTQLSFSDSNKKKIEKFKFADILNPIFKLFLILNNFLKEIT